MAMSVYVDEHQVARAIAEGELDLVTIIAVMMDDHGEDAEAAARRLGRAAAHAHVDMFLETLGEARKAVQA